MIDRRHLLLGAALGALATRLAQATTMSRVTAYAFTFKALDGTDILLASYAGHPILLVNTASLCGYTPQYTGLQALWTRYRGKGLMVLAVPSNDFGGQEPGTNAEIKTFCELKYKTTFPLFEKIDVNGDGQSPIYAELEKTPDAEGYTGDVRWNFEKFLVGRDASVTRFAPQVTPEDPTLLVAIESALH